MGVRPYSRVVWSEGMHLAQHHFQAQARYLEASATFALSRLCFKPYGFIHLNLDYEAIREGSISFLEARGVMPDGSAFEFPLGDPLPPPLEAVDGSETAGVARPVYLAVPTLHVGRPNCEEDTGSNETPSRYRYRAVSTPVQDEVTGEDKRDVLLASKNFRILYGEDLTEDLVSLPMAQIRRGPSGHFEYRPEFIPPSLDLGASARLPALLRGLVETLRAKAGVMSQRRAMVGDDLADLSSEEVLSYWMAHSIHSGLAALGHILTLPRSHPETLFREMARLAGSLSTFSMDHDPGDLPPYDHDNLTECFGELDRTLRKLLQVMIPESFVLVRLEKTGPNVLSAPLEDARVFRKSEWVLQVSAETGGEDLLRSVPSLLKVCSAEDILRLVEDANPGLPLEHLSQLPSSIPRRLGAHYFRALQKGPCWQLIQGRSTIGIYVPDVLAGVRIDLIVIQT